MENGTNVSELPILIPSLDEEGRYIVVEGNRRIAVLKILSTPELASGAVKPSLEKRFKKLSEKFIERPIDSLTCVVFNTREEAAHWIELRHTGENAGAGIVRWERADQERFSSRRGNKKSPQLQILDFVRERGNLSEEGRNNLSNFAITSLQRLIEDADVQEKLGIKLEQGTFLTKYSDQEVLKGLTKIVEDLASQRIKTSDIYTKKQRLSYINGLKEETLPDRSNQHTEYRELGFENETEGTPPSSSSTTPQKTRSKPPSKIRNTLIPRHFILAIVQTRINNIYHELKKLHIEDYPNAVAVMLRVFIELSLDDYIERNGLTSRYHIDEKSNLSNKLQIVAQHLKDNNLMNDHQLQPVRRAFADKNALISAATLHGYVHNKSFSPIPSDLRAVWDDLQPFIQQIWS